MSPDNSPAVMLDEDVRYVTDELYEDVFAFYRQCTDWDGTATHQTDCVAVIMREAHLLDQRKYESWLKLYSRHCIYWVPGRATVGDPREEPALHFDDHRRMTDRVALIRTGFLHAQTPPSRTCRIVGTVETASRSKESCDIFSSVLIDAYRQGSHLRYAGHQYHRLAKQSEEWRIQYRILVLNDRDGSHGNITFIL